MKKLWLPMAAALAFVGIAVAGWFWKQTPGASTITCVDPHLGCTFIHQGLPIQLRFSELPRPFEPFALAVIAPGVAQASAEFQMADMDMGFNRHDLKRAANNRFTASVSLPACVSGQHDWMTHLVLDGRRYTFRFRNRE